MTLTIPATAVKKPDTLEIPLFDESVYASCEKTSTKRRSEPLHATTSVQVAQLCVFLVIGSLLAFLAALTIYGMNMEKKEEAAHAAAEAAAQASATSYKGYCSVPVDNLVEQRHIEFRSKPIRLSDPDVEVLSTMDEDTSDNMAKFLSEELEIGDDMEKILVAGAAGQLTTFLHDWTTNMTGIMDGSRCLVSGLEPALALPPAVFAIHIARGSPFRVSRARSELRATPDSSPLLSRALRLHCQGKPVYQLTHVNTYLSKRSVEERAAHYVHFAGQHVHEMEIVNMAEVLAHEAAGKQ